MEDTIASMTLEEKIGQLFDNMGASRTEEYLTQVLRDYKFGAVRQYVHKIPAIFISFSTPFLLADAPAVKCYINAYDARPATLEVTVKKLAEGAEAFKGVSPVDAFCGFPDTRI